MNKYCSKHTQNISHNEFIESCRKVSRMKMTGDTKQPTTIENDIVELDLKFKFKCSDCDMTYPSKHGLSIHQARFCKKSKTAKKPSRRGTVADRFVKRLKTEIKQNSCPKVKINGEEIDNVLSFVYL